MKNYYEVIIYTVKADVKGKEKTVKERYLVNAMSFTEAEAKITSEMRMVHKEFEIKNINPYKVDEVYQHEMQKYFVCIIAFEDSDSKILKAKFLVNANDMDSAKENGDAILEQYGLAGIGIDSLRETKIVEVYE